MEYLLNRAEMNRYDTYTITQIGMTALVLMERAALAVVEELISNGFDLAKVAVICGYGNNGGDGIAIARLLKLQQIDVALYLVGNPATITDSTQQQLNIAEKYQLYPQPIPENLTDYSTIVDALFGIGLSRIITGEYAVAIDKINQSQADIIAVDIPSGICADSGSILGHAVKAQQTVCFAYKKRGTVFYPGCEYCGTVTVKDIGINAASFLKQPPAVYSYTEGDLATLLPRRTNYSNKGSFGKALIIAGSQAMSGATYFSAKAAYKSGCGLVRIYTPEINRAILLGQLPEAIMTAYDPTNIDDQQLMDALNWASVVVMGPGMSTAISTQQILAKVIQYAKVPVIIDADGLNVLAQNIDLLSGHPQSIIITPHLGEMARLATTTIANIAGDLIGYASEFATQHQLTCVLKDARTVVASHITETNGSCYVNQSGNNGMATAGSGDVLTGIIAGLIAQRCSPALAATLGVYLHGLAGDQAWHSSNQYSMTAEDIITGLVATLTRVEFD